MHPRNWRWRAGKRAVRKRHRWRRRRPQRAHHARAARAPHREGSNLLHLLCGHRPTRLLRRAQSYCRANNEREHVCRGQVRHRIDDMKAYALNAGRGQAIILSIRHLSVKYIERPRSPVWQLDGSRRMRGVRMRGSRRVSRVIT